MSSSKIKVGIFLVGGAILFAVGLFLIGSRKQLFAHHFEIYTKFNKIDTLQPGAQVRVSGNGCRRDYRHPGPTHSVR